MSTPRATATADVAIVGDRRRPGHPARRPSRTCSSGSTPSRHDTGPVGRDRPRPRDRARARRGDGRHAPRSSRRRKAAPASSCRSRRARIARWRSESAGDGLDAGRRRRRSPARDRRPSLPGSTVRRSVASATCPPTVVTVPTSLPSATTVEPRCERRVGAQPAQQPVHVAAAVDAAHQLLAEEATLRERDRVALEERFLRDRRLVDVVALAGNARLDAQASRTRRRRSRDGARVHAGAERRARPIDGSPNSSTPGASGQSTRTDDDRSRVDGRCEQRDRRPGPASASAATSAERSSISTFTRILNRLSPSASTAPKPASHTHHHSSSATMRRAQVDHELALRLQQQRVRALADRDRIEILRQQALEERRRVGTRHHHRRRDRCERRTVGVIGISPSRSGQAGARRPLQSTTPAPCCGIPSASSSATESATIPAPAWSVAWPSRHTIVRIAIAVSRLPEKST